MKKNGFTLIELAIVLVIIGLLIGVGASLLPGLINQQKYTQNQSLLNQNYNTIIGYIMANGRLPLASSNTNGTAGTQNIGYLPYYTVGGLQKDAYSNAFYYAVNNRALNISINGFPATQMSLTNTNNMQNLCASLYALNYYYTHNSSLTSNDIRVINMPGQTQAIPVAFILISSGANGHLDSPDTITKSNGVFAGEQYPLSQDYDDMSKALSVTNAISQFCANSPNTQFNVSFANSIYQLTSIGSSTNSTAPNTNNGKDNKCISKCNQNWWCPLQAFFYGGCSQACQADPNFCP